MTEILNDDLKALREDFHRLSIEIREDNHRGFEKITEEIHRVDKDVSVLGNQVKGIITAIRLLALLTLTSIGGSIWWGATLTADVKNLSVKTDERFVALDKRLDRLEGVILKVIEQTKPASKP